jgi:hypothetical protein
VSQIASRTLEIVDQLLFAEIKRVYAIIGQMAQRKYGFGTPASLEGCTRRKLTHLVQLDGRSNTNPGRKDLQRRLQGK